MRDNRQCFAIPDFHADVIRGAQAAEARAEVSEVDFTGFLVFTLRVSALFQCSFERLESRALILFRPQNCFRALGHEATMAILPIGR